MLEIKFYPKADPEFDNFIAHQPTGHLLQSSRWGQLKELTGWQPLRLGLISQGDILAVISILKLPWIGRTSIFYAPRGPVISESARDFFPQLVKHLRGLAKREKAIFLKIDPPIPQDDQSFHNLLITAGFQPAKNSIIPGGFQSTRGLRVSLPAFSRHTPAPKSCYQDYTIQEVTNPQLLKVYYALLLEFTKIHHLKIREISYFERLWQLYGGLFLIKKSSQYVAGSFGIGFGPVYYSLYPVARQDLLNGAALTCLHQKLIEIATSHRYQTYEIIDPLATTKKGSTPSARPFPMLPIEFTDYLGEYDLVFSRTMYSSWRILTPLYRWAIP